MILDTEGAEHFRSEGFLPKPELLAVLKLGRGRLAFQQMNWAEARKWYEEVAEKHPDSAAAAEAVYWAYVCRYKATDDAATLTEAGEVLARRYPDSIWATKASVWLPRRGEQAA